MKITVEGQVTDLGGVDPKSKFEEVVIILRTDKALVLRPIKNWSLIVDGGE